MRDRALAFRSGTRTPRPAGTSAFLPTGKHGKWPVRAGCMLSSLLSRARFDRYAFCCHPHQTSLPVNTPYTPGTSHMTRLAAPACLALTVALLAAAPARAAFDPPVPPDGPVGARKVAVDRVVPR